MANRFSVEAVFKVINKVTAPVSRMQNKVGKFTRSMNRGFTKLDKTMGKFRGGLKKAAIGAAASLVILSGAMADTINVGADFGRGIGSAAAKFPDDIKRGTAAFKELQDAAMAVGRTTEFTSTDAAKGLNFLAKAGFNAKFSMEALPAIIDFATASEIEFAEAADIASDALGSFGLDSDNLEKKMEGLKRIMDVMGLTANSTNVNVSELFETVRKGAPIAIKAGQSVETFAAVAGTLAQAGIKADVAGTATKNLALALSGVGNQAGKTFKRLNIKLTEAGRMRDIADVFEDLSKSLNGMDDDKILQIMNAIFGKISLASAANLLGKGSGRIRKLREELEKAGGSNTRIAKFIRNDVRGSLDSMKSAIESVKISLFLMNEGPLKNTIDRMTDWIRKNEDLIATKITESIENTISFLSKYGKNILIVIGVIGSLMITLKALILVLTFINLVMASNPIGLIIIGIGLLIVAVAAAIIWWDELKAAFISLPGPVKTALKVISGPIGWLIEAAQIMMNSWDPALGFFENLWNGISNIFKKYVDQIMELVDLVKNGVSSVGEFIGFDSDDFKDEEVDEERKSKNFNRRFSGLVSPEERFGKIYSEQKSKSEVTIKDETGRAEVTKGKFGNGIILQRSGDFD